MTYWTKCFGFYQWIISDFMAFGISVLLFSTGITPEQIHCSSIQNLKLFVKPPPPSFLWPLSPSVILPFPALPSAHLEVKLWWFSNNRDHPKTDHKSSSIHRLAGIPMRDGWVSWMLWCRARFALMCLWSFFPGKMFVTSLIDAQLWFLPEKLISKKPRNLC